MMVAEREMVDCDAFQMLNRVFDWKLILTGFRWGSWLRELVAYEISL